MATQPRSFKSPKHKLVAFFHVGRDKWRERSRSYRRTMRSLQITVRDLENSRDAWKRKYVAERARCLDLETQLAHPPPRTDRTRRASARANRQGR